MENILGLYQKLWKSLIRPRRLPYNIFDLGDNFMAFESTCETLMDFNCAMRMDFKLENHVGESFYLSLFLPCNEKEEIPKDLSYVVYCHTHNGNRTEGLYLVEKVLRAGYGFVVFDFRANGYSTGQFVTLGWLEVLDINAVILFLKTEVKAKFICLWGRSMGGSASLFYSSELFRQRIDTAMTRMNKQKVTWANRAWVDCIVVDSCFPNLVETIQCLVKNKTNGKVPEWLVSLVLSIINREVKNKAFIDIGEINPSNFVKDIRAPIYMAVGNEDELVATDRFVEMFSGVDSKLKKIMIFKGQHADERTDSMLDPIVKYIKEMFRLKLNYLENRANITKMTDMTMNVPLSNLAKLNVNAIKNQEAIRSKTPEKPHTDFQRKNTDVNRTRLKIYEDSNEKKGEHILRNNNMASFLGNNPKLVKPTNTADLKANNNGRVQIIQSSNKNQNPKPNVITNEDYFADFEPETQFRRTRDEKQQELINKEGFNLRLSHKPIQFTEQDLRGNPFTAQQQKEPDDPSILVNPERISQVMRENNIPEQKLKEVAGGNFWNDLSIRVKSSVNFSNKRSHLGNLHQQKLQASNKQPPKIPVRHPEIQTMQTNPNNLQKSEMVPNFMVNQPQKQVVVTLAHERPLSPTPNKVVYVQGHYPPLIPQHSYSKPSNLGMIVSEVVGNPLQQNPNRFANPAYIPQQPPYHHPPVESPVRFLSNQNHQFQHHPTHQHPPQTFIPKEAPNPKTPYVPQLINVENNARRKDYIGRERGRNSFRGSENEDKNLFDFNDFNDFRETRINLTPQLEANGANNRMVNKLTESKFFEAKPSESLAKMVESIQLDKLDISEGKSVDLELSPSPSPLRNPRK
jgi:esterase/lipase